MQKKQRRTGNVIDVMLLFACKQETASENFIVLSLKKEEMSGCHPKVCHQSLPLLSPKNDQKEGSGEKAEKELVIGFGIYDFILYLFYLFYMCNFQLLFSVWTSFFVNITSLSLLLAKIIIIIKVFLIIS